jgi:hypothetical protein
MIPTKVYILYCNLPESKEYLKTAIESCEEIGIPYEPFLGYSFDPVGDDEVNRVLKGVGKSNDKPTQDRLWSKVSQELRTRPIQVNHYMNCGAAAATAGHMLIWNKIVNNRECAIILEHDALMLHKPEIDVPHNMIVALGYKFTDHKKYNHKKAGPPKQILPQSRHAGAHAYALTWETADKLISEVKQKGVFEAIDNAYFMRDKAKQQKATKIPLGIMDPTPAIAWLRKSTLWGASSQSNYNITESFKQNSS